MDVVFLIVNGPSGVKIKNRHDGGLLHGIALLAMKSSMFAFWKLRLSIVTTQLRECLGKSIRKKRDKDSANATSRKKQKFSQECFID